MMGAGRHWNAAPSSPPQSPDPALRRAGWPESGLRVGDAERTAVADRLAWHFSHGRLDQAEFDDRLDRAMRATTIADLRVLLADLPEGGRTGPAPATASRRQERRIRQAELDLQRRRMRQDLRDARRAARVHRMRPLGRAIVLVAAVVVCVAVAVHIATHSVIAWIVLGLIAVVWLRSRVRR